MKTLLLTITLLLSSISFSQTADECYKTSLDLLAKKDLKGALKNIENAILIDQKNIDFYLLKAEIFANAGMYKDGYDCFSVALTIEPKNSLIYSTRGIYLQSFQKFDSSIEDYSKAIELAENDTLKYSYYTNRGSAKSQKRDFIGAYNDYMISYNHDSTNLAVLVNLGTVCDDAGKSDETLKYLLKAVEVDPTFVASYANIGFVYQMRGDHAKALEYYDKVLEMDPNEPLGYSNRSYSRLKTGDVKGALKDIDKSIKIYPTNSYAYKVRALIYIEKKKFEDACADLNTASELGYTTMYGNEVIELQKQHCKK